MARGVISLGLLFCGTVASWGCAAHQEASAKAATPAVEPAGTAIAAQSLICDPAGRTLRVLDENHDGKADTWRYYAATGRSGPILSCELFDLNRDGKIDGRHSYGPDGKVEVTQLDVDYDGTVDVIADFRRPSMAQTGAIGPEGGAPNPAQRF